MDKRFFLPIFHFIMRPFPKQVIKLEWLCHFMYLKPSYLKTYKIRGFTTFIYGAF